MRRRHLRFLAQICLLLAIAASMALLVDSFGVTPAYCSGQGGCHAVKLAAKRVFGAVPVPLLGLLALLGLLGITTLTGSRLARLLETAGAGIGGVCGALLLLIQALVLKTFCPFCVVVDVCAILASAALLVTQRASAPKQSASWLDGVAVIGLAIVACVTPLAWVELRPPAELPPALAKFTRPNRTGVVEFVDLSCGHCRQLYPTLEEFRRQQGDHIHFVRLHAPPSSHRQARMAARLLQCLQPDEPRIDKLTEILFENPRLDQASILTAAEYVGLTAPEVEACWNDASTEKALDDNVRALDALGFLGLPTTYVGGERIVGDVPLTFYLAALERVRRSPRSAAAETAAFCAMIALLVLGIIAIGQRRREPQSRITESQDVSAHRVGG
jgi:protein-disulfide isomerase